MDVKALKQIITWLSFYGYKLVDMMIYFGGKFAGRFIFLFRLLSKPSHFINQPTYYPECELKSKQRIFFDQFFYILRTGEVNKNYFFFGLDRKSKKDISDYVTWFTFTLLRDNKNQKPQKPKFDTFNYVCMLRDKFVFEAFCKGSGISTPTNIALVNHGEVYHKELKRFMPIEALKDMELDAFCKWNRGFGGGLDVMKLQIRNKEVLVNSEPKSFQELKKMFGNGNWIVQDRIKDQHPEFAKFHPHSINTIRLYTVNVNNKIEIFDAFQRIGANGSFLDNWNAGGVVVGINPQTGTLKKWGFFKPGYGTKTDKHPDTHIVFEGVAVYQWKQIVEFATTAHKLFYGIYSVGWDICFTTEGPTLIEGNDNWGQNILQMYEGVKPKFDELFKNKKHLQYQ